MITSTPFSAVCLIGTVLGMRINSAQVDLDLLSKHSAHSDYRGIIDRDRRSEVHKKSVIWGADN